VCAWVVAVVVGQIINSTMGKAMGGATGGYTASCKAIVELLKNKARPYLFSNTLAPSVVRWCSHHRVHGTKSARGD